jgi:hypothetical protein
MQDSYNELIKYCQKLLLIISGLLPIKKRIITSILKIQSLKNIGNLN